VLWIKKSPGIFVYLAMELDWLFMIGAQSTVFTQKIGLKISVF
jgi:hypothetical protein